MAQNYRNYPSHSGFTTSESEDIVIDGIFPSLKEEVNLRAVPLNESKALKRKYIESGESSSDIQSSQEFFRIDNRRRKVNIQEKYEKRRHFSNVGFYSCEVCDAYFRSYKIYESHLNDRSHQKAVKKMKIKMQSNQRKGMHHKMNGHAMVSNETWSKYPTAPPGVIRRKVSDESVIQSVVEKVIYACPGLEHITEIRGLQETLYYCAICNVTCEKEKIISHLKKSKHLLYTLKAIAPREYESLEEINKSKRRNHLYAVLHSYQTKDGIGRIIVEKDYLDDNDTKEKKFIQNRKTLSTSSEQSLICYEGHTYPQNDYFCNNCETSMFDKDMWESHERGRWTQKTVRKNTMASNLRVTAVPKCESFLVDRLGDQDDPIVGLNFIREFQHLTDVKETYHCFICRHCLSFLNIIQHITSMNHRINYIEHINHYSVDEIRRLDPAANKTHYILGEICRTIQKEIGCGRPEVYHIKKID